MMIQENSKTIGDSRINSKKIIISPEFIPIEQNIIRFFEETMNYQGYSSIDAHILGYLSIHNHLTEKQIFELSKIFYHYHQKTGFSIGVISSFLNGNLASAGLIQKKKVPDSKNKYIYSIDRAILIQSELSTRFIINEVMLKYFQKLQWNLQQIVPTNDAESFNYNKLYLLMNQILIIFQSVNEILTPPKNYLQEYYIFDQMLDYVKKRFFPFDQQVFSDKIRTLSEWESIFFESLELTRSFNWKKESYTRIILAFLKNSRLTQEELKEITGFSKGHISQAITELLDAKYIKLADAKEQMKNVYINQSLEYLPLYAIYHLISNFNHWKVQIKQDLELLQQNAPELNKLPGYQDYVDTLQGILVNEPRYVEIQQKANERFSMNETLRQLSQQNEKM